MKTLNQYVIDKNYTAEDRLIDKLGKANLMAYSFSLALHSGCSLMQRITNKEIYNKNFN